MNNNQRRLMLIAAVTLLAACNHGGRDGAPQTTTQIVSDEIATNTNDSAAPILLNDLPISDADTDETSSPVPVL